MWLENRRFYFRKGLRKNFINLFDEEENEHLCHRLGKIKDYT